MMNYKNIRWSKLFAALYPGYFDRPGIRALPAGGEWDEMALDLKTFRPDAVPIDVPDGITFGLYDGDTAALRRDVLRVDEGWPELFNDGSRVYCAFDGGKVASFCLMEHMGDYEGLRVGGPGCVGTLPEYRRRGIGLKMVQNATAMLAEEGFDVSFIHYTGVAGWYAKLGYQTVLRWNHRGLIYERKN